MSCYAKAIHPKMMPKIPNKISRAKVSLVLLIFCHENIWNKNLIEKPAGTLTPTGGLTLNSETRIPPLVNSFYSPLFCLRYSAGVIFRISRNAVANLL